MKKVKPFVLSLSKHERFNFASLGFFHSPFDCSTSSQLRANGKIFNAQVFDNEEIKRG
jgi:hypothetical protein